MERQKEDIKSGTLGERLALLRKRYGYSQQEIADLLDVTRQTISNWECGQGAPALDKAAELAGIYRISLDELAGNFQGSHETAKERKDLHILKKLMGKKCRLEYLDQTEAAIDDLLGNTQVRILDVNECWMRIEYERRREGTLRQKETVVKLVELSKITGAVLTVETEVENG